MNIAELRRLEAEATPGEWEHWGEGGYVTIGKETDDGSVRLMDLFGRSEAEDIANAALIVAMRNALPEWLKAMEWHDMSTAPKDGTVINAVARYPNATAGFPRYIAWLDAFGSEGAWFEMSCNAPERVIPWAWRPRGVWPSDPHGGVDV